jgi:integrase
MRGGARDRWPERDLAFIATDLLTGCRLAELFSLNLSSIDGRAGERRLKVIGKGNKERFLPIEEPLQRIIDGYLETRRVRFPKERHSPTAPLFVDLRGQRMRPGAAEYLVEPCAGRPASGPRCHGGRWCTRCGTRSPPDWPKTAPPPPRFSGCWGTVAEHQPGVRRGLTGRTRR